MARTQYDKTGSLLKIKQESFMLRKVMRLMFLAGTQKDSCANGAC